MPPCPQPVLGAWRQELLVSRKPLANRGSWRWKWGAYLLPILPSAPSFSTQNPAGTPDSTCSPLTGQRCKSWKHFLREGELAPFDGYCMCHPRALAALLGLAL